MISIYKYNEFEEDEFEHFNKKYGGTFTYLSELPHGTKFHVENGYWKGKILHIDGETILQTTTDDSLCIDGENQMKIDKTYSAWITVI